MGGFLPSTSSPPSLSSPGPVARGRSGRSGRSGPGNHDRRDRQGVRLLIGPWSGGEDSLLCI